MTKRWGLALSEAANGQKMRCIKKFCDSQEARYEVEKEINDHWTTYVLAYLFGTDAMAALCSEIPQPVDSLMFKHPCGEEEDLFTWTVAQQFLLPQAVVPGHILHMKKTFKAFHFFPAENVAAPTSIQQTNTLKLQLQQ